jgi:hypothetical protein
MSVNDFPRGSTSDHSLTIFMVLHICLLIHSLRKVMKMAGILSPFSELVLLHIELELSQPLQVGLYPRSPP